MPSIQYATNLAPVYSVFNRENKVSMMAIGPIGAQSLYLAIALAEMHKIRPAAALGQVAIVAG
jgi:hypothetical protein